MKWSPQQDRARTTVARWIASPSAPQCLYLAGYAGTGKTTLAKDLVSNSDHRWLFAAYTGKAAHVLRSKGCDGASTIHSLIYRPAGEANAAEIAKLTEQLSKPETTAPQRLALAQQIIDLRRDSGPRFALWETGPLSSDSIAGIVVDEVSMVDERLGRDLERFGKKILVLGDPAQLPPVKGCGYFTARDPDVMLTEVHRHASESGVLRLATHIREGKQLSGFDSAPDAEILSRRTADREDLAQRSLRADQVIVGLNKTRHDLNRRARQLRNRTEAFPYAGDRLVCLRNERETGLFNGSQWAVVDAKCSPTDETGAFTVRSEDDSRVVACEAWLHYFQGRGDEVAQFGQKRRRHSEFDWGYTLTCHKAQGSQWTSVFVVDESVSASRLQPRRWLYTAVTRAKDNVTVLT